MFKDFFATIFGISYETQILEACSWDEDRADHICDLLSYELTESVKNINGKTEDEILEDLRESLLESLEEHEVDVLISVVTDCIENRAFLLQEIQEFEN
tara:strand:+ start:1342 stop:1638 length:297 start_codon:yes stop_codon:yes gene_type:complete